MKAKIAVQAKCRGEKQTAQRSSSKEEKGKFKVRRYIYDSDNMFEGLGKWMPQVSKQPLHITLR